MKEVEFLKSRLHLMLILTSKIFISAILYTEENLTSAWTLFLLLLLKAKIMFSIMWLPFLEEMALKLLLWLLIPIDAPVLVENVTINAILFQDVKQLVEFTLIELVTFAENLKNMTVNHVFQFVNKTKNTIQSMILATVRLDILEILRLMSADGTVEQTKFGMENAYVKMAARDMVDHVFHAQLILDKEEINVSVIKDIFGIPRSTSVTILTVLLTQMPLSLMANGNVNAILTIIGMTK